MSQRKCKECGEVKKHGDFPKDKGCRDGIRPICKPCNVERTKKYMTPKKRRDYKKAHPWLGSHSNAQQRCNNPKNHAYKFYGAIGREYKLSVECVRGLWFRDEAYLMKEPSIDRINNDGDYTLENCRFIEKQLNCSLGIRSRWDRVKDIKDKLK